MTKYPFVVTVRRASGRGPELQDYSFEDIGVAHLRMTALGGDRSVLSVRLSVVLKEITYHGRVHSWEKGK